MSGIRIEVTAEDIASCALAPDIDEGYQSTHPDGKDPVEVAIARATGQDTMCDEESNEPRVEMATISKGRLSLVVTLPDGVGQWIDEWYAGRDVQPFAFDLELEDWLVALVARAASVDDQARAVIATEQAS